MDRPRIREKFTAKHRKLALAAGGLLLLSGVALGIAKLEPGAPAVARAQLYLDEVKEGTLERKVRGPGVLQPREARWLSTRVDARVDLVLVRAGETVEPDTVIVQLSNPEVERAAVDLDGDSSLREGDVDDGPRPIGKSELVLGDPTRHPRVPQDLDHQPLRLRLRPVSHVGRDRPKLRSPRAPHQPLARDSEIGHRQNLRLARPVRDQSSACRGKEPQQVNDRVGQLGDCHSVESGDRHPRVRDEPRRYSAAPAADYVRSLTEPDRLPRITPTSDRRR